MKAKYDDKSIELTDRFVAALEELLEAQCEMMRAEHPDDADCWEWGRAYVVDVALAQSIVFEFGGYAYIKPNDNLGDFAVVCGSEP